MTTGTDAWYSDICFILNYADMNTDGSTEDCTDLDVLSSVLMRKNRMNWRLEASKKTKLVTFKQIHDFGSHRTLLKANLDRRHRSLVVKLKSGVYPVRLETGRYKGLDREKRICEICNTVLEDEIHFLFECPGLENVRKRFIDTYKITHPEYDSMSNIERLRELLFPENVRQFAKWLEEMTDTRRDKLYSSK